MIQFRFRRGTAAEWTAANPTLSSGELGLETDTAAFKIGDGVTAWASLAYGGIAGPIGPVGPAGISIAGEDGYDGEDSMIPGPAGPPGTRQISISMFFPGAPIALQLMLQFTAPVAFTFPANFSGSLGDIGTNPTATTVLTVALNGATIGTISISTGGVFTFATSGGVNVSVAAGDKLTVVNQTPTDATAADFSVSFLGDT